MVTVKNKQGTATTKVQNLHKGNVMTEQTSQETAGPDAPVADAMPWCEVGVEASLTINLGNFNSTRLQTSLKVPAPHSEIDEVWEFAKDWVNDKMEKLAADAQAAQGDG